MEWEQDYFQLFISYNSKNEGVSVELREALRFYFIDAFVAQKNIQPPEEWRPTVEKALNSCDALLALVTKEFHQSVWTNQEIGWGLGQEKLVIPVNLGTQPQGFISKTQSIDAVGKSVEKLAEDINNALLQSELTKEKIIQIREKHKPKIINPGFEDGETGWEESEESYKYNSQSEIDTEEFHSGKQSKKLFLRQGGTKILQQIPTSLLPGTTVKLSACVKMPVAGTQETKWFTLALRATGIDNEEITKEVELLDVTIPEWRRIECPPLQLDFSTKELSITAMTTRGNGSYTGHDRAVWIDDFEWEVIEPD